MEFSRQDYWRGLPFPSPEELPNPGIEPWPSAWQADSLPFELQGSLTSMVSLPKSITSSNQKKTSDKCKLSEIYKIPKLFKTAKIMKNYTNKLRLKEAAAAAKSLQSCLTLCDPIDGSPSGSIRLHSPWDSPGKNTGAGCHFLLQCMKVKSQSEVAQSFPTLSNPMDWGLPGSSVHGIFQARVLEWGAIAFFGRRLI